MLNAFPPNLISSSSGRSFSTSVAFRCAMKGWEANGEVTVIKACNAGRLVNWMERGFTKQLDPILMVCRECKSILNSNPNDDYLKGERPPPRNCFLPIPEEKDPDNLCSIHCEVLTFQLQKRSLH